MTLRTLLAAAALLLASSIHAAGPRPIDDAERKALEVVAAFLTGGPQAIHAALAADAPLRMLSDAKAIAEIAARTGPATGSVWTLRTVRQPDGKDLANVAFHVRFPSAVDDALLFRMARDGKTWAVREVVSMAEPERSGGTVAGAGTFTKRLLYLFAIATSALFILSSVTRRKRMLSTLFLIGALLGLVLLLPLGLAGARTQQWLAEHVIPLPFVELRALEPLRAALARGATAAIPDGISSDARAVATLWVLQSGAPMEPGDPKAILGAAAGTPMGELMRGRVAQAKANPVEARRALMSAIAMQPARDDIAIAAAMTSGELEVLASSIEQLDAIGSRDASAWYTRALLALGDGDRIGASRAFEVGWRLEPMARRDIARYPLIYAYAAGIHDIEERTVHVSELGTRPMTLPRNRTATVCGASLRVVIGDARLEVPNGAALAPKDARVVTASEWHSVRDEEVLRDAELLLKNVRRATLPALGARRDAAADLLVRMHRWNDFLALTGDIGPSTPRVRLDILRHRIAALLRAERVKEARALTEGAAMKEIIESKSAPALLLAIGDAMLSAGSFDLAEKLYRAANGGDFAELAQARLRQVDLRRRLADGTAASMLVLDHFAIRYDPTVEPEVAQEIGETFERMYAQVEQRLPPSPFRRVTVNVLSAETFHHDVAGSDHILGLYDGEILLPYVRGTGVTPDLVRVITHELTHALVATATADKAPRWFQEGIAQYMEPGAALNLADRDDFTLPVVLLEGFMDNPRDIAGMKTGYLTSLELVRYLDAHHPQWIARLTRSFARDQATEAALRELTGMPIETLTAAFAQWREELRVRPETYTAATEVPSAVPATAEEPKKQKIEIRWSRRP